jgi:ribonuclease Z
VPAARGAAFPFALAGRDLVEPRAMFEVSFLGTAAAVPSPERGLSALLVGHGRRRFLVDCGEGTQRQVMRAGLGFRRLDHVLLTHAHLDHVLGLAGLLATLDLFGARSVVEIVGSGETIGFVRRYLDAVIGPEDSRRYHLRAVVPGPVLALPGLAVEAFPVAHRGTESLGFLFRAADRRPLDRARLDALAVPPGPPRRALARGKSVTLADGRTITPELVAGAVEPGVRLAIVGDTEEIASLVAPVAGADALVVEATFLERDLALARARGHLTAAAAGRLARDAGVGELLLTHISGRYRPEAIRAEAAAVFPNTRLVADFDRAVVKGAGAQPTMLRSGSNG